MEKQSDHCVPHMLHVVSCLSLPRSVTMDNTPVAAFGEGVETADTAPWAVNALGSPGDGPPPLPLRGTAILITRVGEPLGRARGGWRSNVEFDIGEGYAVFKEKCIARYEALIAGPEAPKKPLALPGDVSIYFKRTKNDPQAKRPEASPFEVPADNTTAQAMELDRQRELLQPQENAARDATQTASVKVRLGGMWVPMELIKRLLSYPGLHVATVLEGPEASFFLVACTRTHSNIQNSFRVQAKN
ncbi:uncharacterized protein PITG_14419 [Phytophthora infestans T30-4]|uniref:Uncharacterized protein n=1 Tax=Phytophthora infestans (strain T30-4) TaxID=403677 RepID=D0NPT3_PHYIT|nr:uncharacterized protein PITG_14419 [Phytophthora infestans T30-4]EEY62645.1 hypothetical protein PITG_14419 [Phytophthora infestans T30-4]|eukprot:XP_002898887.1 hypothetical protein PITG_14419 [Phytophthora infestans T30-4]